MPPFAPLSFHDRNAVEMNVFGLVRPDVTQHEVLVQAHANRRLAVAPRVLDGGDAIGHVLPRDVRAAGDDDIASGKERRRALRDVRKREFQIVQPGAPAQRQVAQRPLVSSVEADLRRLVPPVVDRVGSHGDPLGHAARKRVLHVVPPNGVRAVVRVGILDAGQELMGAGHVRHVRAPPDIPLRAQLGAAPVVPATVLDAEHRIVHADHLGILRRVVVAIERAVESPEEQMVLDEQAIGLRRRPVDGRIPVIRPVIPQRRFGRDDQRLARGHRSGKGVRVIGVLVGEGDRDLVLGCHLPRDAHAAVEPLAVGLGHAKARARIGRVDEALGGRCTASTRSG